MCSSDLSSETIWGYLGFDGTPETAGLSAVTEPVPVGQELREPIPVYKKVEIEMEDDKKEQKQQQEKKDKPKEQPQAAPAGPFAMFRRMDLRVGTVVEVSDHPDAEKLFVLKVDCGEGEPRQLVTNLKWRYTAEEMMGRRLIVISNLKPAKFRGVQSMGMLTAADDENLGGETVHLLAPSCDIPNGTRFDCGVEGTSSRIETKHVEQVVMKTVHVVDGKAMGVDMPADAPKVVIAVIDGDDVMILGDGNGCYATIDGDIQDGANVL